MAALSPQLQVDLGTRVAVWRFREEHQLRGYALLLKRKELRFREQWAVLPEGSRFTTSAAIAADLAS